MRRSPLDSPSPEMPADKSSRAVFRELPRDEIELLLARNNVGRLAFAFHDRVDIQPIHYIYERGWIYGRTSEGEKIATLEHNRWIAFEVDEVEDVFNWRSVVVHGSFWKLSPRGSPHAEELWARAADLVGRIVPGSLSDNDPVAFRHTLFRIAVADATGREAKSKPAERSDP